MIHSSIGQKRLLDHTLFPFRSLTDATPFSLDDPHRVALAVTVVLQRFHVDQQPPFPYAGMLDRPYPDVSNATQREVGLRDGLWRLAEAFDRYACNATFVVECDALELLGDSVEILSDRRHCVVAGGRHASLLHTAALAVEDERRIIRECRDTLEQRLRRPVQGWRSPACCQSPATLRLLGEEGFLYCGDFNNDDRPFLVDAGTASLVAMPMHHFSSDLHALYINRQSVSDYLNAVDRGAQWLLQQEHAQAVIVPMVLHPWITGVPHRFRYVAKFLESVCRHAGLGSYNCETMAANYSNEIRRSEFVTPAHSVEATNQR